MKKLFTLFFVLVMSIGVSAQTPLTQAVDFSTIDHHGNEINLFEILDGGQYVLIDFFYTSCGPCQNALPKVVVRIIVVVCWRNFHEENIMLVAT